MSLQQAKNALVSSLFELSNAANDAAAATVNFYKIAGIEGVEASALSFANLGETMNNAVKAVTDSIPDASKATPGSPKAGKKTAAADASGDADEKVKPKKKRAPKDPNAPKKPLTSYLRFNLSVREEMKKERFENGQPCHPAIELNQIIADRWSKLKDSEKEKLQKAWEADYEEYKKAMEKYNASKTEGETAAAAEEEAPASPKVEKKPAPKKKKAKKAAEPAPDYFSEPAEEADEAPEEDETDTKTEEAPAPKKSKKRKDKDADEKKLKKKKSHE